MLDFLVIDNFDSFTYNLVHLCHEVLLAEQGHVGQIEVYRPDEITLAEIARKNPTALLISPGPGTPKEAVFSQAVLEAFGYQKPIFGVCLGMQVIAHHHGENVIPGTPIHGKPFAVYHHDEHPLMEDIPSPFNVIRYHSLQVTIKDSSCSEIQPVAWTKDGTLMALASTRYPMVWGVQFHPESIGSQHGLQLMRNVYKAASRFVPSSVKSSSSGWKSCSRQ